MVAWSLTSPVWAHDVGRKIITETPLLSPTDRKIYGGAFHHADDKRFARALARAAQATEPLPAKVIRWLDLMESSRRGSFAEATEFLVGNPDWPGLGTIQSRAEKMIPADLPDAQVLAWFRAREPRTATGAARYADALARAGDRTQAARVLRRAWIERDFSKRDERAFRKRFREFLRREDELARLDRLLWERRHWPAKRQARRLGGGYPELAEARLLLARMGPGVDWAIRRVPDELRNDPGLTHERARWRRRKRDYTAVAELLDPPDPALTQPARWWPLRHWTTRQALAAGDVSTAYRVAAGHGLESGLGFAEGEWLAGWIALRFLDQPRDAYRHFQRLRMGVSSPISLARSTFWAGEAARVLAARDPAEGWDEAGQGWYRLAAEHGGSFYGQLARGRLGDAAAPDPPRRAPPGEARRKAFDARELVRVVRMLGELGERKLQERFLTRLGAEAGTAEDYMLFAGLAVEQERPDLALRAAKAARRDGIILPDRLFPMPPLPQADVPEPALVLAVIRQESAFDPAAVSRAGALGLMQLLPRTARQVARQLKLRYSRERLTDDPKYNLRLGRAYLSELIERYDGSYILALAAYNAGPARVRRWLDVFGDPRTPEVDPVDWIESIPIYETRNYVQRVLEGLTVYRRRLGAEAPHSALIPALGAIGLRPLP